MTHSHHDFAEGVPHGDRGIGYHLSGLHNKSGKLDYLFARDTLKSAG
jgi:hypothetical protein